MEISAYSSIAPSATPQRGGCEDCAGQGRGKDGNQAAGALSPDEQRQVEKLAARDREVRAHEAAHMAAAGGHANGGASFTYTRGPDGRQYATGGEVSIDTSPVSGDPEATLQKALQIQRAALAPAEPSGQDRQVAAEAAAMATQARQDMAAESETAAGESSGKDAERDAGADLLQRIRDAGGLGERNPAALHLVA